MLLFGVIKGDTGSLDYCSLETMLFRDFAR